MRDYSTARTVLSVISFLGWLMIGAALFVGLFALPKAGIGVIGVAIPIAAAGMIVIAVAQLGMAQIDTAINTRELCNILRNSGTAPSQTSFPQPRHDATVKTYKGVAITRSSSGYMAGGNLYPTVIAAERGIDSTS